jgi:hypothetical protein
VTYLYAIFFAKSHLISMDSIHLRLPWIPRAYQRTFRIKLQCWSIIGRRSNGSSSFWRSPSNNVVYWNPIWLITGRPWRLFASYLPTSSRVSTLAQSHISKSGPMDKYPHHIRLSLRAGCKVSQISFENIELIQGNERSDCSEMYIFMQYMYERCWIQKNELPGLSKII